LFKELFKHLVLRVVWLRGFLLFDVFLDLMLVLVNQLDFIIKWSMNVSYLVFYIFYYYLIWHELGHVLSWVLAGVERDLLIRMLCLSLSWLVASFSLWNYSLILLLINCCLLFSFLIDWARLSLILTRHYLGMLFCWGWGCDYWWWREKP